jgi:DNA-binding NtrC family response regulator/pSer/pThr/pTyr-binding forkhead associated (FHA) protein
MSDESGTIAGVTSVGEALDVGSERAVLVVYGTGDDAPDVAARTRLIELPDGAVVTFGRSRSSTVQIESDRVSRNHAEIERRGRDIVLRDLGSRNGTKLNGERISGEVAIASGDEVAIGPASVVVTVTTRVNRRVPIAPTTHLEERLAAETDRGLRYQRPFALVMIRIEGDAPVVDAAIERIASDIRPMDVLAEYGPDELALLAPEVDAAAVQPLAERVVEWSHRATAGRPPSVHVGVAVFPDHGTQPGELLSRARAALRAARSGGDEAIATPPHEPPVAGADVIVSDAQMRRVFALVQKVADTPLTVLITGETGVGKEVIAEELHRQSARRDRRFVKLNCAAIPQTLLESELFGYERGAFTGAERRRAGYFEAATGGTIFLDEVGEMPAPLQAKLLRVLEERRFSRVGGTEEIEVDVRIVCATNRDLEAEVARGAFREDLYFRVSAFTIMIPPLRDRPREIIPLAELFLRQSARELGTATPTLSREARQCLERYVWPGNVRELRNAIERAVVLKQGDVIQLEDLPARLQDASMLADPLPLSATATSSLELAGDVRERVAEVERAAIEAALEACGGNQTRAAQKLGLSRRTLIYKLEKYGLKRRPTSGR